jgi:glycerophosphoryl diester phosphodiesterase
MKPYLSPAGLKIFAHRGSTEGGAFENTLEAFRFALDSGVRYLETDVQVTSDGVAVLFHDDDLQRVAGIRSKVSDLSFMQLRAIEMPGKSQIPTLAEALARFPNAKWNIDIKANNAVTPTIEAIRAAQAENSVLVSSFSKARRLKAIAKLPGVATSTDAFTLLRIWFLHKLGANQSLSKTLKAVDALQIPVSAGPIRFDSPAFVNKINSFGVEVHYWTINDFDEAKRLVALGAKGIVTDKGKMMIERFGESRGRGK